MSDAKSAAIRVEQRHTLKSGREILLGQLGLSDFTDGKHECLRQYKRQMIETWTANADIMPDGQRDDWIRDAFIRAEKLQFEDLPTRKVSLPVVNPDTGKYSLDPETGGWVMQEVDSPYETWWISESPEGMLYAVWLSMRQCQGQQNFTLRDADELFRDALDDLQNAAQVVGSISESQLAKNSQAPEGTTGATAATQESDEQPGQKTGR